MSAAGATLAHERRGEGEPLLLVHGIGSRWQCWAPTLPRLAIRRDVVAVDLPGFGASPRDGTGPTVVDYAERLERFCEEIGLGTPHVGGNSLGGGIALEMLRRGSARSATCFSPIGFWTPREIGWCQRRLGSGVSAARVLQPYVPVLSRSAVLRTLFGWYLYGRPWAQPPEEMIGSVDAAVGAKGFDDTLAAFSAHRFRDPQELENRRLLIAWGARDYLLPVRQAARAERMLPWGRHVVMPSCGHTPFFDDPDLCAALLLEGSAPSGVSSARTH